MNLKKSVSLSALSKQYYWIPNYCNLLHISARKHVHNASQMGIKAAL